jgi:hypothetical protein
VIEVMTLVLRNILFHRLYGGGMFYVAASFRGFRLALGHCGQLRHGLGTTEHGAG